MKKFLVIALVAAGFLVAAAPESEARVFFNIGIGLPFAYYPAYPGYYGYGYYPYPYPGCYAARVYYSSYRPYYSSYRPYYWYHGRRIYYRHGYR